MPPPTSLRGALLVFALEMSKRAQRHEVTCLRSSAKSLTTRTWTQPPALPAQGSSCPREAWPGLAIVRSFSGSKRHHPALEEHTASLGGPVRRKHVPQQEGPGGRREPVGAESHVLSICKDSGRPAEHGARVGHGASHHPVTNCLTMSPWAMGLSSLGLSFPRCTMTGLD